MNDSVKTRPPLRAPRGTALSCRSWLTEAPLRMLMNNLDPEVAERPQELVVYGGIGKAARNWQCFDEIVAALKALGDDETLLIQSGKPVGVFPTHADAPRVLLANSNLVARWADWDHFNELDRKGLMMFGQMTAGSWIYIGSQGIVQGTYETFVEMGRQHYGGRLAGKWILTAGLGGMGGAQPLAATMAGASMLAVECRPERIAKRLKTRYLDVEARTLDEALEILERARRAAKPVSVGLLGNACEVLPELLRRGVRPDALTDQTSAHDPVNGYLPGGWTLEKWDRLRGEDPAQVARAARASMRAHVEAMLEFQKQKVPVFDYGNNIRQVALDEGLKEAFAFPGFVPAYVRPLFCRGMGPFRWAALSGDPEDIYRTDQKVRELLPGDTQLHHWLDMARERIQFQGLPARLCWGGLGDRHRLGHGRSAQALAQRAALHLRRALADHRARRAPDTRQPHRVGRGRSRPSRGGGARGARPLRRLGHPGTRRQPHPPGVRRHARHRVRRAPSRALVRGDRARGRRHPQHGARGARGERGAAVR